MTNRFWRARGLWRYGAAACALLTFANQAWPQSRDRAREGTDLFPPLGIKTLPDSGNDPVTKPKVELGRFLYFDKRLSKDATISCATCHDPNKGWTDQAAVPTGIQGKKGTRNAPTVLNAAYLAAQFWDGRAISLEEQVKEPIQNPAEMGFSHEGVVERIGKVRGYDRLFEAAFGDKTVTIDRVAQAIASFERTAITGNSAYDRYQAGDADALSASQRAGMGLFFGKANCSICHTGDNFTDNDFHNLGVGMTRKHPDLGRYLVSKVDRDRGAFKTPTLRNLTSTFPYMHDGSQKTLADVVDFYDKGGEKNPWQDPDVQQLGLSVQEKRELVAFLTALDGDKVTVEEPASLPR